MIAFLGWLDRSERERERMRQIIQMFHQRDARDELGVGAIRDSIADRLFPGTSTIQTRLRYFLFVPWIFRYFERQPVAPSQIRERIRQAEVRLIEALLAGAGDDDGIIGRESRDQLQQLPSSVYWSGLGSWGIRRVPGPLEAYLRGYPPDTDRQEAPWHPDLPEPPEDLFQTAAFTLGDDEARFLRQRIVETNPDSLLAELMRYDGHANVAYVWQHPEVPSMPDHLQRLLDHARRFSFVMEGAVYLYNVMVAELLEWDEALERHRANLQSWYDNFDPMDLKAWDRRDFWAAVCHPHHTITPPTQRFVAQWHDLLCDNPGNHDSDDARALIRSREARKGPQSRLYQADARARWGGASQAGRLRFRWPVVRGFLADLAGVGT